jgi:hypothetical protein
MEVRFCASSLTRGHFYKLQTTPLESAGPLAVAVVAGAWILVGARPGELQPGGNMHSTMMVVRCNSIALQALTPQHKHIPIKMLRL